MQPSIDALRLQFKQAAELTRTSIELEQLKVQFLGKKGPIQQLMRGLKDVTNEERPAIGKLINDVKEWMTEWCEKLKQELTAREEEQQLSQEVLDVSLPGRRRSIGRQHPLTQTLDQIIDILLTMGFSVQSGPDIDTDYYSFEVLNIPPDHPARDMQDTFYITPNILLRPHTSNIQAHVMENNTPPIRIIAPGKAFRNESINARSHVFFHQVEAVYIDKNVTFADLFATLNTFLTKLFKQEIQTRYRPSYFPFVEPGLEIDISCLSCQTKGCTLCKQTGWLEIGGAGMIHPEVLKNGGIDPESFSGFAWGLGVERLVMLLKGIQDIRHFTENDQRFLEQFTAI